MLYSLALILSAVTVEIADDPTPSSPTYKIVKLSAIGIAIAFGLRFVFRIGDGPRNNRREQSQERDREADLQNRNGPPRFNG